MPGEAEGLMAIAGLWLSEEVVGVVVASCRKCELGRGFVCGKQNAVVC